MSPRRLFMYEERFRGRLEERGSLFSLRFREDALLIIHRNEFGSRKRRTSRSMFGDASFRTDIRRVKKCPFGHRTKIYGRGIVALFTAPNFPMRNPVHFYDELTRRQVSRFHLETLESEAEYEDAPFWLRQSRHFDKR
jgi:hypothetical protein